MESILLAGSWGSVFVPVYDDWPDSMACILYTGGIISGVLSESKKKVALYPERIIVGIMCLHNVSGDVRNDEIFATGVPSPCVVLGRVE